MKLHLPKGLRMALLACISGFAAIGSSFGTAVLAGGTFASVMYSRAEADELVQDFSDGGSINSADYAGYSLITVSGGVLQVNYGTSGEGGTEFAGSLDVRQGSLELAGSGGYAVAGGATLSTAAGTTLISSGNLSLGGTGKENTQHVMAGDVNLNNGAGTLTIEHAELHFGNPLSTDDVSGTNTLKTSEIIIGSGGQFTFYHSGDAEGTPVFQGADGTATNVTLAGGSFYIQAMLDAPSTFISLGTLAVSGESALDAKYNGHVKFDSLTGSGVLTVGASVDDAYGNYEARFGSLQDFNGELHVTMMGDSIRAYVDSVSASEGVTTTITGKTHSEENFVKTGAGNLTLEEHVAKASFSVMGGEVLVSSKLEVAGETLVDGGTLTFQGDYVVPQVTVRNHGVLRMDIEGDARALDVLSLNQGTLWLRGSYGNQEKRGSIVLGGGSGSESVISGEYTALLSSISGSGDLMLDAAGRINVHSAIDHTGKLSLKGNTMELGNSWNGATSIANLGDVLIDVTDVSLWENSVIANAGDVLVEGGLFSLHQGSLLNDGDSIVSAGATMNVSSGVAISNAGGLLVQGGTVELKGDDHFVTLESGERTEIHDKEIVISGGGLLKVDGSDFIQHNLTLNGGTLELSHSLGSGTDGGALHLGGTEAENAAAIENGTLGENVIRAGNTGIYVSTSGAGNLTFDSTGELNLHNTIQHTGDVILSGSGIGIGKGYGNLAASIKNDGDVILNAQTVSMGMNSSIANKGDIRGEQGSFLVESGSLANEGDIIICAGSSMSVSDGATISNTGAVLIQGGALELWGDKNFVSVEDGVETVVADKEIIVSQSGMLSVEGGDLLQSNVHLNGGSLDMNSCSLGNWEFRGTLWLGGTDAENAAAISNGALTENRITGWNTSLYSVIDGVGNLTIDTEETLYLHNRIQHTGDLSLGGTVQAGSWWAGEAVIENKGDVNISSGQVLLNVVSLRNDGDLNISGGETRLDSTYWLNETDFQYAGTPVIANNGNIVITGGSFAVNENAGIDLCGADDGKGRVLVSGGALELDEGSHFTAKGLEVSGGSVTAADVIDVGNLSLTGGKLLLGNGINITEAVTLTGGTLAVGSDMTVTQDALLGKISFGEEGYNGTITFTGKTWSEGDVAMSGTSGVILGAHESAGSFDVQGLHVTMRGDVVLNEGAGVLSISNGGEVLFGNTISTDSSGGPTISNAGATNTLRASEIIIGEGGKLTFYHLSDEGIGSSVFSGVDGARTNLTLNGGTFYMLTTTSPYRGTIAMGTLTVSGESSLDARDCGFLNFDVLTGGGTLAIAEGFEPVNGNFRAVFGTIRDFNGELQAKDVDGYYRDGCRTYVNSVHQSDTCHAVISGTTRSSGNFIKTGAGSVTMDAHMAEGSFTVAEGTLTTTGALTAQSLALTGGKLLLGGDVSVSGAEGIHLQAGTLAASADVTLSGTATLSGVTLGGEEGYDGTITFAGEARFANTVTNDTNLVFNGNLSLVEGSQLVSTNLLAPGEYSEGDNGFVYARYYLVQEGDSDGDKRVTVAEGATVDGNAVIISGGNAYYDGYGRDYYVHKDASLALDGQMGRATNIIVDAATLAINAAAPEGNTPPSSIQVQNGGVLDVTTSYRGSDITLKDGSISVANVAFGGDRGVERDSITLEGEGQNNLISGKDSAIYADIDGVGDLTVATTPGEMANTLYGSITHQGDLTLSGAVNLGHDWGGGASLANTGDIIIDSSASVTVHRDSTLDNTGAVKIMGGYLRVEGSQMEKDYSGTAQSIRMNGGTLDLACSLGSSAKWSGILSLESTAEDGTLSENVIRGGNTDIRMSVWGKGNLTLESTGTLNLHYTFGNDGDVTLSGQSIGIADGAYFVNAGDVIIRTTVTANGDIDNYGDIRLEGGALTVESGILGNKGDIIIDSSSSLTLSGGYINDLDAKSVFVQGGMLVLKDDAGLGSEIQTVLTDGGSLHAESASMYGELKAGSMTLTRAAGAEEAVAYSQVKVEENSLSSLAEGATISGAHISIAEGGAGVISGVQLSASVLTVAGTLTLDAAGMDGAMLADGSVLKVQETGSVTADNGAVGIFSGEHSLVVGGLSDDGQAGAYTLMSTSQLSGLVLGGDACFEVNLNGLLDELGEDFHLGLVLTGLSISEAEAMALGSEALLEKSLGRYFTLAGAGEFTLARVETDGADTVLYLDHANDAVPEPTTVTLSLLSLAALAARRRRK